MQKRAKALSGAAFLGEYGTGRDQFGILREEAQSGLMTQKLCISIIQTFIVMLDS
jgi:hypothetical protein